VIERGGIADREPAQDDGAGLDDDLLDRRLVLRDPGVGSVAILPHGRRSRGYKERRRHAVMAHAHVRAEVARNNAVHGGSFRSVLAFSFGPAAPHRPA
jgi:hypothetical protein